MSNLSPAQQLIGWIRTCDELHGDECQAVPMSARSKEQIPQWVIDTDQACIVPGSTAPRYAALSYVWPEQAAGSDRLMLERSNVESLQKPGALTSGLISRLPLVIRETIDLLRDIQERYLWVDCLCIVQHDGETQSQAYRMNEIYSGAYFTIIAAASEGLFGTDSSVQHRSKHINTAESHYDDLMRSNWATRGWTFQEQILSRRAIIFMDPYRVWGRPSPIRARRESGVAEQTVAEITSHVFWDCQCAVWDGGKLGPESDTSSVEERTLNVGTHMKGINTSPARLCNAAWPDFRGYLESVCLFNNRSLTYPQDVLVAFSGVLNELGHSFPGGFAQGLPHCFIDETLIWQPFSKAVKRENVLHDDGIAPYRYLPSWSWCSWKCPVDPYSLVTGLEYSVDLDPRFRRSWSTKPLVDWSVVSADLSYVTPLRDSAIQYNCRKLASNGTSWETEGWTKHCQLSDGGKDLTYFTHISSGSQRTHFPLPVTNKRSSSLEQITLPYLSCTTQWAYFTVRDYFYCHTLDEFQWQSPMKTSVFDLPQFKDSPGPKNACSVVSLEDAVGEWCGVLRVMGGETITPGREVELIAISRGEAKYSDVVRFFEERVDFLRKFEYKNGREWLYWKALTSTQAKQRDLLLYKAYLKLADRSASVTTVSQKVAQSRPKDLVEAFNRSRTYGNGQPKEGVYHFYNVMWIEWEGSVAYRRAVGRIRKEAWERYCSEPVKIVLG